MQADERADVAALFAAVAGIGPFFAVAAGREPAGGGWVPVRALGGEPSHDDPLTTRVRLVGEGLGTDARVAASTVFQGLAAQLVAPLFAVVAIEGALPSGESGPGGLADVLHWRAGGAGPWLWWAGERPAVVPADAAALRALLDGLLAPLVAAVRARASVSERVLWSDAASAVASARRLVAAARPAGAVRATAVAEQLLAAAPLAGAAALRTPEPPDLRWTFRRRSCCLYYRVPGGGLCDDCVLRDRRPRR